MTAPTHTAKRAGTYLGYITDKCRCDDCKAGWRDYQNKRNRDIAYRGRIVRQRVDPARAVAHLARLRDQGVSCDTVSQAVGIATKTLEEIRIGRRRFIYGDTERAILGFTPPLDRMANRARLDGTGTIRRLQALQAIGWSLADMAARLGCSSSNLVQISRETMVRAKTARAVRDLYAELWDKQPPVGYSRTIALKRAAANGWPPPAAWDNIDDPNAEPQGAGTDRLRTAAETVAEVEWLLRFDPSATAGQLANRLGYADRSGIHNSLERAGRQDIVHRLTRNAELAGFNVKVRRSA